MEKFVVKASRFAFYFFILAQGAIWGVLLFADIGWHKYLAYANVALCFAYSFAFLRKENHTILQCGAFACTCVADFFLILLEGAYKTTAMFFFLGAQLLYAVRVFLLCEGQKEKSLQIWLRIAASAASLICLLAVLKEDAQLLFAVSLVYYVNLVISLIFAFIHWKQGISVRLLAVGLLCFACCDLSIGFDFLIDIFSLGESSFLYFITHLPISFVTLFYPPSQTLLCLSTHADEFFAQKD